MAGEPQAVQVDRFMASQAILLSMPGVPGIYVHSLFGSRNWQEGVAATGQNRTINRRKFTRAALEAELADSASIPHQVFTRYPGTDRGPHGRSRPSIPTGQCMP